MKQLATEMKVERDIFRGVYFCSFPYQQPLIKGDSELVGLKDSVS